MLKIFRNIRRSLIGGSDIRKYLLYAIGEILLVVIGILIALQINNWNENRKSQAEAFNYLAEINREFKLNKIELERIVLNHQKVLQACEAIIPLFPISPDKVPLDSLSKHLNETWNYYVFLPLQNALQSFVERPAFHHMQDQRLKAILSRWKIVYEVYNRTENDAMDFVLDEYDPYTRDNFQYDFDLTDPRMDMALLQSFKFENLVRERAFRQKDILGHRVNDLQLLQKTINEIIVLTDQKINGQN